jgi:hypothetical protein
VGMVENKKYFSRIRDEGIKEIIWAFLRSWIWPLVVPALTAILGYMQGLPLMYIFLGTVAAFAFVTHGLVKITEWRFIRTPEHKLDFIEPNVGAVYDKTDERKITDIYLGIKLNSGAAFPMNVEVDKFKSKFNNIVPAVPGPKIRKLTVGISGSCFFNDGLIDIRGIDLKDKEIRSSVSFTVKYGIPGNVIYTYSRSIDVIWAFDKNGYYKSHVWSNSVEPFD